ncbi:MAG: hypothetical protein WCS37_02050 [Chloroflexota bacterium]|nr:hypothetical protein [Chloroflexota bacterium]
MFSLVADATLTDISILINHIVQSGEREIVITAPTGGVLFHNVQDLYDYELLQGMSQSLKWEVTLLTESLLQAELARAFGFNARVLETESGPEPTPEELWPSGEEEDDLLRIATPSSKGFFRIEVERAFTALDQLIAALLEQHQADYKDFLIQVPVDSPLFRVWDDFVTMQEVAVQYGLNLRFESFLPSFVLMANTAGFYVTQHPRLQSATIDELKSYAEVMRNSEYSSLQRLAEIIEPTIAMMEEGNLEEAGRLLNGRATRLVQEFFADPANRIRFAKEDATLPDEGIRSLEEVTEFAGHHFDRRYRSVR